MSEITLQSLFLVKGLVSLAATATTAAGKSSTYPPKKPPYKECSFVMPWVYCELYVQ